MASDKGVLVAKDINTTLTDTNRTDMSKIRVSVEDIITLVVQSRRFLHKKEGSGLTYYLTIPHEIAVFKGVTKGEKWTIGLIKREVQPL